jgi:hypothetical protein
MKRNCLNSGDLVKITVYAKGYSEHFKVDTVGLVISFNTRSSCVVYTMLAPDGCIIKRTDINAKLIQSMKQVVV